MKKTNVFLKGIVSKFSLVGLLLYTVIYGIIWYNIYFDMVFTANRIPFWEKGNWLMIVIYFVLLFIFSKAFEKNKREFFKVLDAFSTDALTIICVNMITFFQIALLGVWTFNTWGDKVVYILIATLVDLIIAAILAIVNQKLYVGLIPPEKLLLVYGRDSIVRIKEEFEKCKYYYVVKDCIHIDVGVDEIKRLSVLGYDGIVLCDIPDKMRNKLLKFFYSNSMRVYLLPKISDVLVRGSEALHVFDIPLFLVREYSMTVEQRVLKRVVDVALSFVLIIITFPIMILTALMIKINDPGPIIYKQVRCTKDKKEFFIYKFRSMKIDAEKDGIARLAKQNDNRVTSIGKFIRKVRIDELPQLFNILAGDMSFIGPRPERPELINNYITEMPEFVFRMKVKAGLGGYAQVFGKYNTLPYDKLKLDLTYIENYSIWLDFKLMLLTLKTLFNPESTEGLKENAKQKEV